MSPPTAEFQLQLKPVPPGIPQCSVSPAESCRSPVPAGLWGRTGSRAHPSQGGPVLPGHGDKQKLLRQGQRCPPALGEPWQWGQLALLCRTHGEGCRQPRAVVCTQSWGFRDCSAFNELLWKSELRVVFLPDKCSPI